MSEEEARKRQIEAARATREYAPVMAQEVSTVSEHTPGPWHVEHDASIRASLEGQDVQLAAMSRTSWTTDDPRHYLTKVLRDQTPANARLIAAAPDLLATLKAILDVLKPDSLGYLQGDVNLLTCEHMIQAREAIKEAEGA